MGPVCWYCCRREIPPTEAHLMQPLPRDMPDEESPDWEWTFRQAPYYTLNIGSRRRPELLRTRICFRCGAYSAIAGLTPGSRAERFQEPCIYIKATQRRNHASVRSRRCGCPEDFAGLASWCCEVVNGIACDFAADDRESEVAGSFDDGLTGNDENDFDSSDEENPWTALSLAPLSIE